MILIWRIIMFNCSFGSVTSNCNITFANNITFVNGASSPADNYGIDLAASYNFNGIVNIPNYITNCAQMFYGCHSYNRPFTIPSGVTNCSVMFEECWVFNKPISIPSGVTNCKRMFFNCVEFNQLVEIPNGVTDCAAIFYNCPNYDRNVYLPDACGNHYYNVLYNCKKMRKSISVPSYEYRNNLPYTIGGSELFHNNHVGATIESRAEGLHITQVQSKYWINNEYWSDGFGVTFRFYGYAYPWVYGQYECHGGAEFGDVAQSSLENAERTYQQLLSDGLNRINDYLANNP